MIIERERRKVLSQVKRMNGIVEFKANERAHERIKRLSNIRLKEVFKQIVEDQFFSPENKSSIVQLISICINKDIKQETFTCLNISSNEKLAFLLKVIKLLLTFC